MASRALIEFNTFVDSQQLTTVQKTRLKELGERFYVMVVKEEAYHIRKHLLAAKAQHPDKTDVADFWNGLLQKVIDEEARLTMLTAEALNDGNE